MTKPDSQKFIELNIKIENFCQLSATTGIIKNLSSNAFFFDATKSEGQQFTKLNKEITNLY